MKADRPANNLISFLSSGNSTLYTRQRKMDQQLYILAG